jgi:hypothetical protein
MKYNNQSGQTLAWKTLKYRGKLIPQYQISTSGKVRRVIDRYGRTSTGTFMTAYKSGGRNGKGYDQVRLSVHGVHITCRVHQAVMETFSGAPMGADVNHKDGNKSNNCLSNLEYTTHSENMRHAINTGLIDKKGSKHPLAKLTEADVLLIRKLAEEKVPYIVIAERFGTSKKYVGAIKRRARWGHI